MEARVPGAPCAHQHVRLPAHIVDLAAAELRTATGEYVELRPRSFAVLKLLAENAGHSSAKMP